MDHHRVVKEQFWHLLFGVLFFLVIGAAAVGLDLLAESVGHLGVSAFTASALGFTAHAMLVSDLVLFFIYLLVASRDMIKGMMK